MYIVLEIWNAEYVAIPETVWAEEQCQQQDERNIQGNEKDLKLEWKNIFEKYIQILTLQCQKIKQEKNKCIQFYTTISEVSFMELNGGPYLLSKISLAIWKHSRVNSVTTEVKEYNGIDLIPTNSP